jgi:hypothetical protein
MHPLNLICTLRAVASTHISHHAIRLLLVTCCLQIMELESKVTQLQEEVDKGGGGAAKKQNGENIPRPPCKYTLSGHRNNINSVRYAPHDAHDTRHTRHDNVCSR